MLSSKWIEDTTTLLESPVDIDALLTRLYNISFQMGKVAGKEGNQVQRAQFANLANDRKRIEDQIRDLARN